MDLVPPAIRLCERGIEVNERYLRGRRYLVLRERGVAEVRTRRRSTRNRIQRKTRLAFQRTYCTISVNSWRYQKVPVHTPFPGRYS